MEGVPSPRGPYLNVNLEFHDMQVWSMDEVEDYAANLTPFDPEGWLPVSVLPEVERGTDLKVEIWLGEVVTAIYCWKVDEDQSTLSFWDQTSARKGDVSQLHWGGLWGHYIEHERWRPMSKGPTSE